MIARPPFFKRINPRETKLAKIETINKSVNRTNWIVFGHVVLKLRQGRNVLWLRSIPSTKPDIRRSRPPIHKENHSIRATFHTAWAHRVGGQGVEFRQLSRSCGSTRTGDPRPASSRMPPGHAGSGVLSCPPQGKQRGNVMRKNSMLAAAAGTRHRIGKRCASRRSHAHELGWNEGHVDRPRHRLRGRNQSQGHATYGAPGAIRGRIMAGEPMTCSCFPPPASTTS